MAAAHFRLHALHHISPLGVALQWPVGRLSDRMDRRRVLFGVCACAALVGSVGHAVVGMAPAALLPMGVALGGLMFTVYGLSAAHVNGLIEPERVREVTGGLLLVRGVGATPVPAAAKSACASGRQLAGGPATGPARDRFALRPDAALMRRVPTGG